MVIPQHLKPTEETRRMVDDELMSLYRGEFEAVTRFLEDLETLDELQRLLQVYAEVKVTLVWPAGMETSMNLIIFGHDHEQIEGDKNLLKQLIDGFRRFQQKVKEQFEKYDSKESP